jgi:hypothetical protein
MAGKSWPSGLWRETFYIPLPEKVRPENSGNYLQIRPENPAASNCRYSRKILASNYQIWPENLAASNYRNGRKIPARSTMIAIASYTQGCSGAMVEYLVPQSQIYSRFSFYN